MMPPDAPPDSENLHEWEAYALSYLAEQLREAVPSSLASPVVFPRSPLEGEGATVLFEFRACRGGGDEEDYYVVVGRTEPNYYLRQNLTAEEAFELHLGTRFMLEMGVAQVARAPATTPYHPAEDARNIVDRVAPGATIDDLEVAAAFDVGGQTHAVLRCRLEGEPVYIMARDAPPGFSRRTDLSPHVAYRLHIGHVLRREPKPKEEAGPSS